MDDNMDELNQVQDIKPSIAEMKETGNEETHLNDMYKEELEIKDEEDFGEYLRDEGIDDYIRIDELKRQMIAGNDETKIYDDKNIDQSVGLKDENDDYDSLRNEKQYSLRNKKQKKRLLDHDSDQDEDETEVFFNCRKCKREFKSKLALHNHGTYCLEKTKIITYKCSLCSEKFDTNEELVYHKRIHQNKQCFFCNPCKLAFSDHCDYLIHNVIHLRGYRVHCKECGVYILKTSYRRHIEGHFERLHECKKCNKFYNGDDNYRIHLKSHTTQLKCGECGKILKTTQSFQHHMATHTGYKPYQCLYCGMGFVNKKNRVVHMKRHVHQEFKCEFCPYVGRMQTALNRHLVEHMNEKKYQCDVCKKMFYRKEDVRKHLSRNHENKKYFKCKQCSKVYLAVEALTNHVINWHLNKNKKPYSCNLCKIGFNWKGTWQRHFDTVSHKNEVLKRKASAQS